MRAPADAGPEDRDRDPSYSNIYPDDYVGPEKCSECHPDKYRFWSRNLHHGMNRLVGEPGVVKGDFSGVELSYGDGRVRFGRRGGDHVMTFVRGGEVVRRFRVTRTIGRRYLQEYVGVQIEGPEEAGDPIYSTEIRLPFGFWLRKKGWFHRQYFDSWYGPEYRDDGAMALDPYQPDRAPWASRCAWCHNTYPFELRALRAQGRRPVGQGTEQYFELTAFRRSARFRERLVQDNLLPTDELVTVGISCESCHLGGREHAEELEPISFAPKSPDLRLRDDAPDLSGGRHNPVLVDTICAQCHSTPAPRYPNGAAVRNSSEALDLAAGACMPAIKCIDCHDPHIKGPGAGAPDQRRHLEACTGCHPQYATPDAARAHSHHAPKDASCLDCHMPKIVQGVTGFVRTHRISVPGSPAMMAAGAPNACNLCHLDRSIGWTRRELAVLWGRKVKLLGAKGRGWMAKPAGALWLDSELYTLRVTAAAAYARSRRLGRGALGALLRRLDDPIAYARMRMLFAIEDVLGRALGRSEYDPMAAPGRRAAQVRRLLGREGRGEL